MNLQSIYVANGTGIFILLMLHYTSRTKTFRRQWEDRVFSFMVLGVMAACFMEAFSYTLDGKTFPGARVLNYAANTYLYFANLLLPFSVLVYVDLGLYGDVKRINDQFGHSEGDRAIKTLTGLLKQARRGNEWVFRFAGDEFIVLKLASSTDELKPYMEEVNRLLDAYNRDKPPYPLALSYGFSFFSQGDVDAFMKEMDDNMYVMKEAHHRRGQ